MHLDNFASKITPAANLSCQQKLKFKFSSAKMCLLWGITDNIFPCEMYAVAQTRSEI